MTVFKILFVLALAVPVAAVLMYFVINMTDDFRLIRDGRDPEFDEEIPDDQPKKRQRRPKAKKQPKSQQKKPVKKVNHFADTRELKDLKYTGGRGYTPEVKREKVASYYKSPDTSGFPDYPKDPYADYKRPDFDSYIRNANARDKIMREELDDHERKSIRKKKKRKSKGRIKR